MPSIHIISQTNASIGEVTDNIVPYLEEIFEVTHEFKYLHPQIPRSTDILLMHYIHPAYLEPVMFDYFKLKVLIQPLDGTKIEEGMVKLFDRFDIIIVPSYANRQILVDHGIDNGKITVIPNMVKKSDIWVHTPTPEFVFYTEFYDQKRKNPIAILDSFKLFNEGHPGNEARLVLKTVMNKAATKELKKQIKDRNLSKKVTLVQGYLNDDRMKQLWQSANCYVNLSGIEGFSIPLLRFTLNNVPTIAIWNSKSGYQDFIDPTYLVHGGELAKDTDNEMYTNESEWVVPDIVSVARAMNSVYERDLHRTYYGLSLEIYGEYNDGVIGRSYADLLDLAFKDVESRSPGLQAYDASKVSVQYHSPYGTSGYAIAGKQYLSALSEKTNLVWRDMRFGEKAEDEFPDEPLDYLREERPEIIKYDMNVVHSTPEWWADRIDDNARLNVGYTVWETSKVHPDWIQWLNMMDVVVVPCHWNKIVLIGEPGLRVPVHVIPHMAPDIVYTKNRNPNEYKFYTIGQWTERKQIDKVIEAFCRAFDAGDNVSLTIKTFGRNYGAKEKELIERKVKALHKMYPKPPKIKLLLSETSYDEIINLHRTHDCYVSLARAEGYGLPSFEAALHENLVIMTGYGGQLDYLKANPEWLVGYEMVDVEGMDHIPWYQSNQQWAEPDVDHCVDLMVRAYEQDVRRPETPYNIHHRHSKEYIMQQWLNLYNKYKDGGRS